MFGGGTEDARGGTALSLQKIFYQINPGIKEYTVKLRVTRRINRGEVVESYGLSEMRVIINQPPVNGTCTFEKRFIDKESGLASYKATSAGRSLIDEYRLKCIDWVDNEGHLINKYKFTGK